MIESQLLHVWHERYPDISLESHLLCLGIVGSRAHGMYVPPTEPDGTDDTDYMGILVPPYSRTVGLKSFEHFVFQDNNTGLDVTIYSLRKFASLLLKSNPNVMSFLWLNETDYVHRLPEFENLLLARSLFLSKRIYQSFMGYASAQVAKMEVGEYKGYMGQRRKELVDRFGYDPKKAAHAVRLLRMGIECLVHKELRVDRGRCGDADELLAIKHGRWSLEAVKKKADSLFAIAKGTLPMSTLPDGPDEQSVDMIVRLITRWVWMDNYEIGPLMFDVGSVAGKLLPPLPELDDILQALTLRRR
jgi:predicted nucleotidyltransferase